VTARRPTRLKTFDYKGKHRYFVTCTTEARQKRFVSSNVVVAVTDQILRTCEERCFTVLAYVFMEDHMHLLVSAVDSEGRSSIWSMSVDGGTLTLLVRFDDPTRESNRREFDTDGQRIYFTLARKEGDVGVMDVR
jgi:REP element-mobilizing transposase RayT